MINDDFFSSVDSKITSSVDDLPTRIILMNNKKKKKNEIQINANLVTVVDPLRIIIKYQYASGYDDSAANYSILFPSVSVFLCYKIGNVPTEHSSSLSRPSRVLLLNRIDNTILIWS